jgi:hypothetical protein
VTGRVSREPGCRHKRDCAAVGPGLCRGCSAAWREECARRNEGSLALKLPAALARKLYAHCLLCGDDAHDVAIDAVTLMLDAAGWDRRLVADAAYGPTAL